jgi:hypothetical protein
VLSDGALPELTGIQADAISRQTVYWVSQVPGLLSASTSTPHLMPAGGRALHAHMCHFQAWRRSATSADPERALKARADRASRTENR